VIGPADQHAVFEPEYYLAAAARFDPVATIPPRAVTQ
jgi:hypothetical protein